MKLSVEERDEALALIDPVQKQYLTDIMTRSRRTHFANVLARQKGAIVPKGASFEEIESLLDEWIYVGYVDAGEVTPDLRCECGRPLRYQHIVEHKRDGTVLKFGIQHLQEHLRIDARIVQEIVNGFEAIDLELDEILGKYRMNWNNDDHLPPEARFISLPKDLQQHLDLNVPLLNRQIQKIRQLYHQTMFHPAPLRRSSPPVPAPAVSTAVDYGDYDLFSVPTEPEQKGARASPSGPSGGFGEHIRLAVLDYLQQGLGSARIICERLIAEEHLPDERYSTGKPHIYFRVCQLIEEYVHMGYCEVVEIDQADRKYRWGG